VPKQSVRANDTPERQILSERLVTKFARPVPQREKRLGLRRKSPPVRPGHVINASKTGSVIEDRHLLPASIDDHARKPTVERPEAGDADVAICRQQGLGIHSVTHLVRRVVVAEMLSKEQQGHPVLLVDHGSHRRLRSAVIPSNIQTALRDTTHDSCDQG